MVQSSIAIAVCDHAFTVRFFNRAMGERIDRAPRTPAGLLRGDAVLQSLGVDDVAAAMAASMVNGSWQDVTVPGAAHVAIEPFANDDDAGGWLITARAPLPAPMTERTLIARSVRLTPREREVMLALAEGASNKAIALRLGISPRTVEFHRAKIMHRFAAKSVVELVRKVANDARSSGATKSQA